MRSLTVLIVAVALVLLGCPQQPTGPISLRWETYYSGSGLLDWGLVQSGGQIRFYYPADRVVLTTTSPTAKLKTVRLDAVVRTNIGDEDISLTFDGQGNAVIGADGSSSPYVGRTKGSAEVAAVLVMLGIGASYQVALAVAKLGLVAVASAYPIVVTLVAAGGSGNWGQGWNWEVSLPINPALLSSKVTITLEDGTVMPFILEPSPGSLDSDGDGLPDSWEIWHGLNHQSYLGNDGAQGDPDGDGLPNWLEYWLGTYPNGPFGPDSDHDGIGDGEEYFTGTDPLDPNDPGTTTLVMVPELAGLTEANARSAIIGVGLQVGIVSQQQSATVPAGRVISSSPSAGSQVSAGSMVDLTVSSGNSAPSAEVRIITPSPGAVFTTTVGGVVNMAVAVYINGDPARGPYRLVVVNHQGDVQRVDNAGLNCNHNFTFTLGVKGAGLLTARLIDQAGGAVETFIAYTVN